MLILKFLIGFIFLLLVPMLLGMIFTKFLKENCNFCFSLIFGYIIQFALLEVLAIPMILLKIKFSVLFYTWVISIVVLSILSIILNISKFKNMINIKFNGKLELISVVAIIFVLMQIFISIFYTHIDNDDSFYIGTATTTIKENSMYIVSAYNGEVYGQLPSRYVLAPFPLYTAIVSYILDLNPAIVAHSIFAPVFIFLAYVVYMIIASKLFDKNKKDIGIFIILLSIINIFGNFSRYTTFSFLLFRIWQGKAILCNIMLPIIWLLVWNFVEDKCFTNWFLVFLAMIATCFVTEMGIALGSITLILLAIIFAISNKKIYDFMLLSLCEIPYIIVFLIFLMIR